MTTANILTGRIISLTIGGDALTNCKFARWKLVHTVSPRLLPSSKIPVGWLQGHSWIEGELGMQSLSAELDAHVPVGADMTAISPFVITGVNAAGTNIVYTFTGAILQTVDKMLEGGEPVYVYHFLAYSVVET